MLSVVFEGPTDEPVVRKLAAEAGFEITLAMAAQGKARLDAALQKYVAAARRSPWFVLRDLDSDAECAPQWIEGRTLGELCLRIAVRETESWLLADDEAFSAFFRVSRARVPPRPDELRDPKRAIVDLVQHSTSPRLRAAIVPAPGRATQVGPGFVATIVEFATNHWRPAVASRRSESLERARRAMSSLRQRWS
ncbi:MAG: hypothetical protein ACOZQL_23105 [Myxococcota bacterium]